MELEALRFTVPPIDLRPMLHDEEQLDEEQLADFRCDSGNLSDVRYYHAGVYQHNLQDRANSTRGGIWDLVTTALISMDKSQSRE